MGIFFLKKSSLFNRFIREYYQSAKQIRFKAKHFVGPDLVRLLITFANSLYGPNCLQSLSADDNTNKELAKINK